MASNIKMYWWNEQPNFGDALNPHLVEKLSRKKVEWSSLESADIVGAGSLLQWVAKVEDKIKRPLHVWGSGYMFDQEPPITNELVIHHAVRGHKTKEFGHLDNVALGDSGLLADLLIDRPITKKYLIGIVPHLWHLDDPVLAELLKLYADIKLIDVRLDPLKVIKLIAECEFVFSSSLHGLIVADSFGVPNQWIQLDTPLFGGNWKFEDYYSAFDITQEPLTLVPDPQITDAVSTLVKGYERPGIEVVKKQLLESFPF